MESKKINDIVQTDLKEGQRLGDYVIEEKITSGGMGTIYRATQISMRRTVALKVLHKKYSSNTLYTEHLLHEVRLLAKLEHANIVQVLEACYENETAFFAMEYIQGLDLKCEIAAYHRFSELEALRIIRDIIKALDYAWKKARIVHSDIKPANIIVAGDTVKLLDLGISRQIPLHPENTPEQKDNAPPGFMIGSPTYMSPEQVRNESDIDFRSDMYSLGITLFQMLDGKVPYDSFNPVAAASMHIAAPIPDIRNTRPYITGDTALMLMKMMAKRSCDRYSSWEELLSIVEKKIRELENTPSGFVDTGDGKKKFLFFSAKMQTHRLVALLIVLFLFLLAFFSVVQRSLQEYRDKELREHIDNLILKAGTAEPEQRNKILETLATAVSTLHDSVLKQKVLAASDALQKKMKDEELERYRLRRDDELRMLRQRSLELEDGGYFPEALKLWQDYAEYGDFMRDPQMNAEIQNAIEYIKRRIERQETGL